MKIKSQILLYFSISVISLTCISSILIYVFFHEYREEEFQQRQNQKIIYTLGLISQYQELSENLTALMDKNTIHDFYDEKMLIFDNKKQLIYKSIDDLLIPNYKEILNSLSPANQWIEQADSNNYDIVGVYIEHEDRHYYAISKAYDDSGLSKLIFLRNLLIIITLFITAVVLIITYFISYKITKPLVDFASALKVYDLQQKSLPLLYLNNTSYEVDNLANKFNELILRINKSISFQKYAIQHISHELRTPLSILLLQLQKIQTIDNEQEKKVILEKLVLKTKSLGDLISVLLELSKLDAGQQLPLSAVRIDTILFELLEEFSAIQSNFHFNLIFTTEYFEETHLEVKGHALLIRQCFANLMHNCIIHSKANYATIEIDCAISNILVLKFINTGDAIPKKERENLFQHFFRGENSFNKAGLGLGLVLCERIVRLHQGSISYTPLAEGQNCFNIKFPV